MTVAVLGVVAALLCWPSRARPAARLAVLDGPALASSEPTGVRSRLLLLAAVAVVGSLLVGGPWWVAAALGALSVWGARLRPAVGPGPDEVAVLADLMAACLSAGASTGAALSAAATAAGPWLATQVGPVLEALGHGAPPEEAWLNWLDDTRLAPIARTCIRTAGSGAAAAAELVRVAARVRAARRAASQQRVARAAIWIVLPLGACFLPAFVAVGVVPLVVSLVAQLH